MNVAAAFRNRTCLITLIACLFAPAPGLAAEVDYGCARTLRIGIAEFGPLFESGRGADVELIEELARRSGCKLEIVSLSRAAVWTSLEDGSIDLATNQISTPQRETLARFVMIFGVENMMVTPAEKGAASVPFESFVDRSKARLGLVRAYRYGNFYDFHLKSLLGEARVVEFSTHRELFKALLQGRVEAVLSAPIHYYYFLDEGQRRNFALVDPSPAPATPSGLAFSRRSFSAAEVNNWFRLVEGMRLDHSIHRYLARHLTRAAMDALTEY